MSRQKLTTGAVAGLVAITVACSITSTPQAEEGVRLSKSAKAEPPPITIDDLNSRPVIGYLGQPLGKIVTIDGTIYDEDQEHRKAPRGNLLDVSHVDGVPLKQVRRIDFRADAFVDVKKDQFSDGDRFRLVGYEDGGFSGPPNGVFDYVGPYATVGRYFRTQFVVLKSEFKLPKRPKRIPRKAPNGKADLFSPL